MTADWSVQIHALDSAIWEMGEAFKGLGDEDVWRRPHPRLLSVGELAAHVAYWESVSFLGEGHESPLVDRVARYYPVTVDEPIARDLGAEAVIKEVERIHLACMEAFRALSPSPEEPNPYREGWTWATLVEYQAFHIAYHTGQMYSVRHLLGHETVDN